MFSTKALYTGYNYLVLSVHWIRSGWSKAEKQGCVWRFWSSCEISHGGFNDGIYYGEGRSEELRLKGDISVYYWELYICYSPSVDYWWVLYTLSMLFLIYINQKPFCILHVGNWHSILVVHFTILISNANYRLVGSICVECTCGLQLNPNSLYINICMSMSGCQQSG